MREGRRCFERRNVFNFLWNILYANGIISGYTREDLSALFVGLDLEAKNYLFRTKFDEFNKSLNMRYCELQYLLRVIKY